MHDNVIGHTAVYRLRDTSFCGTEEGLQIAPYMFQKENKFKKQESFFR